jgi:23S rRNA (guanine2445-N2)-methyltransferase / 23S rRNA (guanine2069-N7)-methyltransferase
VDRPQLKLLASAPRGLADLLARELEACGALQLRERSTGVAFAGTLESAYRACLWSRTANRIFLEIAHFEARDLAEFDAGVRRVDWSLHLKPGATLACDFSGRHPLITHTHFGALKLKDGIVDALRAATGTRPDVAVVRPAVRVHAHARGSEITLALDLSGESLHRRGYRGAAGEAPLKENVAAGMLLRAGWEALAPEGAEFLDPLCGSGTLVIEAALMALDRAPGLTRDYFGFLGWGGHEAPLWERLRAQAVERARTLAGGPSLRGTDRDGQAIAGARANAVRAGVAQAVEFETGELRDAAPRTAGAHGGLLATNPPYGVRLEDRDAARAVHRELGSVLRERFRGWSAAVLTGAPDLGRELGLRAHRTHALWNGGIECRLLRFRVEEESARVPGTLGKGLASLKDTAGAKMFGNRLAKNIKRLRGWATRICRSMPSPSISTALSSRRRTGCTCRSTQRLRRSRPRPCAAGAARCWQHCRRSPASLPSASACAPAAARPAASNTRKSMSASVSRWWPRVGCASTSISTTISTPACFSTSG